MVDLVSVEPKNIQDSTLSRDLWHKGEPDEIILKTLIEEHQKYWKPVGKKNTKKLELRTKSLCKSFSKEYQRALIELSESRNDKKFLN